MTDSNSKPILAEKLAKGVPYKRFLCYKHDDVLELIHKANIERHPKKIMTNIGTNDIKYADGETTEVVKPATRINLSSLFPRRKRDTLIPTIEELNVYIEIVCDRTPLMAFLIIRKSMNPPI